MNAKIKVKRARLSIDLEAYPDVKEMLAEAIRATGDSPTSITIRALQNSLPAVVAALTEERRQGAARFLQRYPNNDSKRRLQSDSSGEPIHAGCSTPGATGA